MRREFRLPDIGEGIAEVEIVEWYVGVGDPISSDQVVASIETDKSVVEMPTPLSGIVTELGGKAGDVLPVGAILLAVDAAAEPHGLVAGTETPPAWETHPPPAPKPGPEALGHGRGQGPPATTRPKASPAVRRLAIEHGVDLVGVPGSGPGGRIIADDVLAAARDRAAGGADVEPEGAARTPSAVPAAGEDVRVPLRGLRRQIARNMVESWRTIPHIIDYREVDASSLIVLRRSLRGADPERAALLTYVPILVKVTAMALRRHPLMNASFDEAADEYVLHHGVHVGIATASPDGLLVPVVRDADTKSIASLAEEISGLVEGARTRTATRAQLTGGTYTVNNLGALGATMGTPIIRPPEVGIAGFGRIADRVVARTGEPAVRPIMMLSSVGDHRLHDGDTLGAFTSTLVRFLEDPQQLLMELA